MASSTARRWLDKVYLVYFLIHIPVLFCVDLVPLYPAWLWVPADAPLHCLHDLRVYYLETYNDRFFAPPPAEVPSFFALYALMEAFFHLPVSVWAAGRLLSGGGKVKGGERRKKEGSLDDGGAELLLLVYGIQTVLTTATCMYEAWLWDPAVVSADQKLVLLGGFYGGYLAVAVVLTVDMYTRLLKRLRIADTAMKKIQ
ncbi:hypothetical protein SLS62_005964 [Diatrype stigma]|uniref:EXPERA domain-containing protein n=1 Tax=Diatrype stigma TaxID=117547 RepID=A0AAN9URG5_9PEZI